MPEAPVAALARRLYQRPHVDVFVGPGKRRLGVITSCHVEMGYDMATPTANFTVAQTTPPFWESGDIVRIDMGYGGAGGVMLMVFGGEIEVDDRKYSPRLITVQAAGFSKKLTRPYGNTAIPVDGVPAPAFSYNSQTDTQIWNDLMRRAGVPLYAAGDGDAITYATQKAYDVAVGTKLGDVVSKLDASSKNGQRTFEIAGRVLRGKVLGVPSVNVAWHYAEGVRGLTAPFLPIIDITRNVSDKDIQNQVVVTGVANTSSTDTTSAPVTASVQAVNDKLGKDGDGGDIYVPHTLSSDFLETRDQCTDVAKRYMIELNKETDDLTMKVALNPSIFPGQSVGIISSKMDLAGERPYWVRHVSHDVDASGGFTNLHLEGGAGPTGYLIGLPPVANFEMFVTSEAFEVGGVMGMWYTVTADGTTSYDPDGFIASYAWSSSTGGSGSGPIFTQRFSQAQWDDPATTITLTVTDGDTDPTGPHHNTLVQGVAAALAGDQPPVDGLYVAAGAQADASADGGLTWGTWVADSGARVISVTRLSPGLAYFGLDDGRLLLTQDHLETSPTVAHAWVSRQITAVAVSEVDNNIVVVGMDNGDVWMTYDAFATPPILKRNFSWPIKWINGSIEQLTQWRVATGSYVWITYDDFVSVGTLATQANKVTQIELSNFANYNVEDVDARVKVEGGGTTVAWPALSPAPVHASLAHFLRTDELMAIDDQGRAFVKAPGATAFTPITSPAGGEGFALMAGRTNPKAFYAGTADGLYKSYDAGLTWYRVRNYTGTGLDAIEIGLDSEPVAIRVLAQIIEFVSVPKYIHPATSSYAGGQLIPSTADGTEWTWVMAQRNHWPVARAYTTGVAPSVAFPNFQTYAFDDSAWEPAEYAGGGYSIELLPRAWTMTPVRDPANIMMYDSYMLFRHVMAVPLGTLPYLKGILTVIGYHNIEAIWFNEVAIWGAGTTRSAQHSQTGIPQLPGQPNLDGLHYFDVLDLVVPGANNLLVLQLTTAAFGIVPGAVVWRLMLNTNPNLAQETAGPATVYVTALEEARGYDLLNMTQVRDAVPGTPYLLDPPAGWTNPTFDDASWQRPIAPLRYAAPLVPSDPADPSISLLFGSSWIGTSYVYPGNGGAGMGCALRQHWAIPEGVYTSALLSLRWKHTVAVWFNGTLVYQNNDDNPPVAIPAPPTFGKFGEMLNIDVLVNLVPGQDNVLCILATRPDASPLIWYPQDFVGACAILSVQ